METSKFEAHKFKGVFLENIKEHKISEKFCNRLIQERI
jgi:hypothetical protein